ncbi:MAG TPA: homoserine dehydrogenase [Candidatus Aminicenantes bacterium]|nr:homoserine dehydrogenase [Candidatus Aminicenantes bacterium]HRY65249.1 homoserine dehydrogenase [Candidatus Aminicenantes bacterium]HRZ72283.1 homoserine dehydrogenase [Candidatus Aminicenantes bacterium]
MRQIPLVVTGFGHVGRAFVSLLREKREDLERRYGLGFQVLAVARTEGCFYTGGPLDVRQVSRGGYVWTDGNPCWHKGLAVTEIIGRQDPGGGLVECTRSNLETGEPGLSYISAALAAGWHAVAASKGALVVGLPKLKAAAAENGTFLKFSGAAAAALPTLDVGIFSLAGTRIEGIQGILNGTSNFILTRMSEGLAYDEALKEAQDRGIAEADPVHDVGGWDSACKILLITNACLDTAYVLKDVHVTGITGLGPDFIRSAGREGRSVKLLATAAPGRQGGRWSLDVRPSLIEASHPLAHVNGTEKGITFLTDSMGSVTLTGGRSNPRGAAAALLKDLINIFRPPF